MNNQDIELINMKEVVERLKSITHVSLDLDLARLMEIESRQVAQWKSRNTVPTEKLTEFCIKMGLDLQFILTGKKSKKPEENKIPTRANYSAFPELEMIFKEAGSLWKRLDPTSRLKLASKISKELQTAKDIVKKPKN